MIGSQLLEMLGPTARVYMNGECKYILLGFKITSMEICDKIAGDEINLNSDNIKCLD